MTTSTTSTKRKIFVAVSVIGAVTAAGLKFLSGTVWATGYDVRNCPGCVGRIDWSYEKRGGEHSVVQSRHRKAFDEDGAVVFEGALPKAKVDDLASEVENNLPNTFMSDVLAKFTLPQYRRYEHRVDTRSELLRDWAVHGPFGKWASDLLGVAQVRLYNAEIIYSSGTDSKMRNCSTAWHRDSIAFPGSPETKSVTFNVYLDDIGPDEPHGDVLVFMKGTHRDLVRPPPPQSPGTESAEDTLFEPQLKVGDVLAHNPHVYHSPSGRGCWHRRSLQFRYFSASTTTKTETEADADADGSTSATTEPTKFAFGRNRWPHGPIPWSLAHSPDLFPHGLNDGDVLAGPAYPLVHPEPVDEEHKPLDGNIWTIQKVLSMAKECQETATGGSGSSSSNEDGTASAAPQKPPLGFLTFDGPVVESNVDEFVIATLPQGVTVPYHKDSPAYRQFVKTGAL